MPTGIIEINDAGIRAGIDGEIRITSPGYAVMDGNRLLVGEEAIRNARLLPRWTNNRFWNQLGTDPIPNGTDMVRHHADIAFAHLEQVWQDISQADKVILAVPGFYHRPQLGLLLGMAQECNIPVAGLVDNSLATVSNLAAHPTVLHLDIYLHRITLTVLRSDSLLRQVDAITISETGLFTLWDRWANAIASQFIQASRYDPMHQAVSEQQLFDQLPEWIQGLGDERSTMFELDADGSRQRVAISREQLLTACATIYPQIVQLVRDHAPGSELASLFVSHRFAGFPGLADSLGLIENVEVTHLSAETTFDSIRAHEAMLVSGNDNISHITSLPVSLQRPPSAAQQRGDRRATHLLVDNHGVAISNALGVGITSEGEIQLGAESPAFTLYARGTQTMLDNHAGAAVTCNGEAVASGSMVQPGDRLGLGEHSMTLISVG